MSHNNADFLHVAFLFEKRWVYPPSIDDMKVTYVTRELIGRKAKVTWLRFGSKDQTEFKDGINFVTIGLSNMQQKFRPLFILLHLVTFCLVSGVKCVYIDEWLMFRSKPSSQLVLRIALKLVRIRSVFDLRDPYVDYQVAYGSREALGARYRILSLQYTLTYILSDLIILPSEAYAETYARELGIQKEKILGIPRGIDADLFNLKISGENTRSQLGLKDKFVIGWFGMMHRYRVEVLIPFIKKIRSYIPNAHVIIGGKGTFLSSFTRLQTEGPDYPFTLLGLVPYSDLGKYIAACDVLLCPVNPSFRFTKNSLWLKILETLAVGRPIIATETNTRYRDFKNLRGILWTGSKFEEFCSAAKEVHDNYQHYLSVAIDQALDFENYSIDCTIPKIVDRMLALK